LEYLESGEKERKEEAEEESLEYLSPESLVDLRNRAVAPMCSSEKFDIFCVGVLALNICLL
jgi:hypothetical protein